MKIDLCKINQVPESVSKPIVHPDLSIVLTYEEISIQFVTVVLPLGTLDIRVCSICCGRSSFMYFRVQNIYRVIAGDQIPWCLMIVGGGGGHIAPA